MQETPVEDHIERCDSLHQEVLAESRQLFVKQPTTVRLRYTSLLRKSVNTAAISSMTSNMGTSHEVRRDARLVVNLDRMNNLLSVLELHHTR